MPQLTLKKLEERLEDLDYQFYEYVKLTNQRNDDLKADIQTLGEGFVEVDRLIQELRETNLGIPLDLVRAVIEALHGVRLQRAGEYAQALELKYFPVPDVEVEEGD